MAPTYRARWRGDEYPAAVDPQPDQLFIRLYREGPTDGFDEIAPDRYVRTVPATECETVLHVTTVCEWRGTPFQLIDERGDELAAGVHRWAGPGGKRLGLRRVERGVYRAVVPRAEVRGLRESVVLLSV